MRAITLHRPWPFAIFHAPPERLKDVENRDWSAHWIVGEPIALHAGQKIDRPAFDFIESVCGVRPPEDGGPTGIVGVVRFDDMLEDWPSQWFTGKIGWLIGWREALSEPVPCPGTHKIWTVPPDAEVALRSRVTAWPPLLPKGDR